MDRDRGREEIVPALISDTIDKVLIGVTTLEVLGLQVDPLTGKTKRMATTTISSTVLSQSHV